MDLGVTDKVRPLIAAVRAMVRDEIMPLEAEYDGRGRARRRPVQADQADGRDPRIPESQGARQRPVELLAHRLRQGLRPHHRRIRLSRRRDGLVAARLRGLQLLRARHRQHGSDRALRLARAEGALAARSSRRARALGLSDDRARRRLVGCDQHRHGRAARRRRMGAQRREMVVVRGRRSALLALHHHDADRPGRRPARPSFDAARAGRDARGSRSCAR